MTPYSPNSEVHFLNVPLENNYKNQITYASRTAQSVEMLKYKKFTLKDLTYIRKDNILRVPKHIDEIRDCNYVMYNNNVNDARFFYAFITNMTYVNDERTDVKIETDVWQTWFDKVDIRPSFVEREHVLNDTVGIHTYPEGLETGEYTCNSYAVDPEMDNLLKDMCYVMASTLSLTKSGDKYPAATGGIYNGIVSGVSYYRFDTIAELNNVIEGYGNAGQSDGINGIFMCPKFLAPASGKTVSHSTTPSSYGVGIVKPLNAIDGYKPKNNKLYCYPFQYLNVSNNNGGSAIYRYEDFSNFNTCEFKVRGAITPGCSIRIIPTNYKGASQNEEEGLNLGKFPICNWITDMYTNWMVQNSASIQNSINQNMFNGVVGAGSSLLGLNLGGAVSSVGNAYFNIQGIMAEKEKQSLVPPQANGNVNCGDVIASSGNNNFHFYDMCIKFEYASKIDNFFEMYGYRVNTLKVPEIDTRPHWNFVKTIGANINGSIPQDDLKKIREMFDNGVTFWRTLENVGDYSLDNHLEDYKM